MGIRPDQADRVQPGWGEAEGHCGPKQDDGCNDRCDRPTLAGVDLGSLSGHYL